MDELVAAIRKDLVVLIAALHTVKQLPAPEIARTYLVTRDYLAGNADCIHKALDAVAALTDARLKDLNQAHRLGDDIIFYAQTYLGLARAEVDVAKTRTADDPSNASGMLHYEASELEPLERVLRIALHAADTGTAPVKMHPVFKYLPHVLTKKVTIVHGAHPPRVKAWVYGGTYAENAQAFQSVTISLPPGVPPIAREAAASVGENAPTPIDAAFTTTLIVPKAALDATLAAFKGAGFTVDVAGGR